MKKKDLERRLAIIEEKLGIVNETLKLEVGKWYKYLDHENWKLCVTYIDDNKVMGYGVDLNGGWMRSGKWGVIEDVLDKLIECTPNEIREALEREAKRRYKVGDKVECLVSRMPSIITEPPYVSTSSSVNAETDCLFSGYIYLFQNGVWAEVVEKTSDKSFEYRIKPEEEPKIGDYVKAWYKSEDQFAVGVVKEIIDRGNFKFDIRHICYPDTSTSILYPNAKSLTKQEAINLLFGDEQNED